MASSGLAPEAVGVTRLRPDEGIIGRVGATGETVNIAEAASHPAYAYHPETGEESFASLLAVPMRRTGANVGVLVLQRRARGAFPVEDAEALLTVAMVLAEILASRPRGEWAPSSPRHFRGVSLAPGIVRGRIVLGAGYRRPPETIAADRTAEIVRLDRAVIRMNEGLDALLAGHGSETEPARAILETTRALVGAPGWLRRVREKLDEGLVAEAAIHAVVADLRARMHEIADPDLRERIADLEDTAYALLAALDETNGSEFERLPPGSILLVRRLGPAKLLHWQARGIAGLVIAEASPAGHAAILARSMGLPAIGGVDATWAGTEEGVEAVLDADEGRLLIRPEPEVDRYYERALERLAAEGRAWGALRDAPNLTLDGERFSLLLNAGLPAELSELDRLGAVGIGLFRTEIFALARGEIPSEEEQVAFYRRAFERAGDRQIVFRTLDLGADKMLPGSEPPEEENPAMGWRSLRIGLDNPGVLRRQLRAMLVAAGPHKLCVMFPMIADVGEFERARDICAEERMALGIPSARVSIGAMLEVPALLHQLPALFAAADFVSIGSNDLFQFLFAADRGVPRLAQRYDLFSAASLVAVESVVAAGLAADKPVSLCGELAARPLEALTLLALGVHALSMSPRSLPRVKAALLGADLCRTRDELARLRADGLTGAGLRAAMASFAADAAIAM